MLMSTVIAVAVGIVPTDRDPAVVRADADYSAQVGRNSQSTDRHGATRLHGFDRTGAPYEIIVEKDGSALAMIGDRLITFHVRENA